jgi:hypothetical protein
MTKNGLEADLSADAHAGPEAQASDESGTEDVDIIPGSTATEQGFNCHGAAAADTDAVSTSTQTFSLPKRIHSAASLVNGMSSRMKPAAGQLDATRDAMSLSREQAQVRPQTEIGRVCLTIRGIGRMSMPLTGTELEWGAMHHPQMLQLLLCIK